MKSMQNVIILVAALLLAACGQPESGQSGQADTAETGTGLDMSLGANKVTADDYRHEPVPVAEKSVTSVDASGNIAPFGMASRAPREIAPVQVAAVAAATPAGAQQSAVYAAQCVACHGADAKGVQGLGLNLVTSTLVADSTTDELVAFLKVGRLPNSPDSVSGIPMPAFAWMPQADLEEVATYLKSL